MEKVQCNKCGAMVSPFTIVNYDYYEGICRECSKELRGVK